MRELTKMNSLIFKIIMALVGGNKLPARQNTVITSKLINVNQIEIDVTAAVTKNLSASFDQRLEAIHQSHIRIRAGLKEIKERQARQMEFDRFIYLNNLN